MEIGPQNEHVTSLQLIEGRPSKAVLLMKGSSGPVTLPFVEISARWLARTKMLIPRMWEYLGACPCDTGLNTPNNRSAQIFNKI